MSFIAESVNLLQFHERTYLSTDVTYLHLRRSVRIFNALYGGSSGSNSQNAFIGGHYRPVLRFKQGEN